MVFSGGGGGGGGIEDVEAALLAFFVFAGIVYSVSDVRKPVKCRIETLVEVY